MKEFDVVRLKDNQVGAILEIFDDGAYLVEIADEFGRTLDLRTITLEDIVETIYIS